MSGHPEYRWTSGIETTTGPLGQGVRPVSGWRLQACGWQPGSTGLASTYSITTYMSSAVMVISWRGYRARLLLLQATSSFRTSAGSTTTTESPLRGILR